MRVDEMGNRAVLYARVSSKEQEQEGFSIPAQQKLLREHAQRRDLQVVKEFIDVETAKQAGRAGFNEMLEYLKKNPQVRYLLCEKTDRLSRNFWDIATLDDLMNKQDLVIVLVKENAELSKESRSHEKFIFGIKALMAKNYIDNLSEEVKKGHQEKAAQGEYPSIAPLGYKNNLLTHRIEVDENEAPAVRRLYELYVTGRYSLKQLRQVAKDAELLGRRSKRELSKSEVERILKNPIYYGMFRWKGKVWPGIHTPIISKELFDQVQEMFASQNRAKTRRHRFAFGNVMRCARCGCRITAGRIKGRYVYYWCTGFRGKCGQPYVPERELEPRMREIVVAVRIGEERVAWLTKLLRESHEDEKAYHDAQIKGFTARYEQLQSRLDQIYLDKLDKKIPTELWEQKSAEWRREQDEIRTQLAKHQNANQGYMEEGIRIFELAQRFVPLYDVARPEEKQEILRFLLLNCTLNDATPTPTYRKPFNWLVELADMKYGGADGI